tara:strand:- start:189 stop:788 length:600 start_codon:yes stop_codon:yes gene_type:complete
MFIKNNYVIIPKIIGRELTTFLYTYFKNRRDVYLYLNTIKFISPFNTSYGTFSDTQIPNTYAHYGDMALDNLLPHVKKKIEGVIKMKLVENYTYGRIYKKYDTLIRHTDRKSCEVSGTMMLGGDEWPIFLKDKQKNIVEVNLKPGDMLLYKGCVLEHWRNPFEGSLCAQVFIHYNEKNKETENTKFDGRAFVGIPKEAK